MCVCTHAGVLMWSSEESMEGLFFHQVGSMNQTSALMVRAYIMPMKDYHETPDSCPCDKTSVKSMPSFSCMQQYN